MGEKYVVTYSCVDNQAREYIWDASQANISEEEADAFSKVIQYCNTDVWPEPKIEDGRCSIEWGFSPCDAPEHFDARICSMPKIQGVFYREVLKPIAHVIAKECFYSRVLYLSIMKEAYRIAGTKDYERVKLELAYDKEKEAIKNAFCYRDAINFMEHEMDYAPDFVAEENIAMIVEAFEYINILEVRPYCEN